MQATIRVYQEGHQPQMKQVEFELSGSFLEANSTMKGEMLAPNREAVQREAARVLRCAVHVAQNLSSGPQWLVFAAGDNRKPIAVFHEAIKATVELVA